jgi:drug/metabolite transporter (DMT)-like permease
MRIVIFIFLCIVWGTTWVAIKVTLEGFPPFLGAAFRFAVASLLLFSFLRLKNISMKIKRSDFFMISLSAFFLYALDYGLIYWGEQYLSAGVTAIFFATFPLFTGIWATFLFRNESFRWNKFVGLLLALAGVVVVFLDQLILTQFDQMIILGVAAIISGAAFAAIALVLVKKYLATVQPVALSFHQMLQGVIFLLVFSLFLENPTLVTLNMRVIIAVCYLGAVGSALAFALYYFLLQQMSAITLSLIIYITPIIALIFDYLVFGEVIQIRAIIGMFIIFAGIAFVELDLKRLNTFHKRFKVHHNNKHLNS